MLADLMRAVKGVAKGVAFLLVASIGGGIVGLAIFYTGEAFGKCCTAGGDGRIDGTASMFELILGLYILAMAAGILWIIWGYVKSVKKRATEEKAQ